MNGMKFLLLGCLAALLLAAACMAPQQATGDVAIL
jgi:hypothetical protein